MPNNLSPAIVLHPNPRRSRLFRSSGAEATPLQPAATISSSVYHPMARKLFGRYGIVVLRANTSSNEQNSLFSLSPAPEDPLPPHGFKGGETPSERTWKTKKRGRKPGGNDEAGDEKMMHLDFPETSPIASTFKKHSY
ncbi:hypothetical protein F5887DRAFT_1076535 [Amanita rubescens]|nr:hypothetical protein F5887DRAFT_1076535 [Amanita rubescens]